MDLAAAPPQPMLNPLSITTLAQTGAAAAPPIAYWIALVLVVAGLGLIAVVGISFLRNRNNPNGVTDANSAPVGTTQEAERLLRLMGEAEELCTRLGNQLDEKAERIERLIARSEIPADRPSEPLTARPGARPDPAARPEPAPRHEPTSRPEIVTRPMGVPQAVGAAHSIASPYYTPPALESAPAATPQFTPTYTSGAATRTAIAPAAPAAPAPAMSTDQISEQIFRLADSGVAPAEIAKRLGQHTGKVELILALRNT